LPSCAFPSVLAPLRVELDRVDRCTFFITSLLCSARLLRERSVRATPFVMEI
jgi:hypothetical protein